MKLLIEIDSNNSAFEGDGAVDEAVRILQKIINAVESRYIEQDEPIYDINGNRVGKFYLNLE